MMNYIFFIGLWFGVIWNEHRIVKLEEALQVEQAKQANSYLILGKRVDDIRNTCELLK